MAHFIFIRKEEFSTLTKLKMRAKFPISVFLFFLFASASTGNALGQKYLDTATPEEAVTRDKPYQYLQNEIQKKLCDKDWGIDKSSFSFLMQKQTWQKIVRGGQTVRLTFTNGGDDCIIKLLETSALYHANLDSTIAASNTMVAIMKWGFDQQKAIMQAKDPSAAAQRFKIDKKKTIDSLSALNNKLKRKGTHLFNEQTFAEVSLILNNDRIVGKEPQDFRTFKVQQLNGLPGIQQAILYSQLPDEETPDTSYRAALYIGDFPKYSLKTQSYSFKYDTKNIWTDKQHSGKPIIENCTVWINTYHYENMMKVINSIDWSGLKSKIKNN